MCYYYGKVISNNINKQFPVREISMIMIMTRQKLPNNNIMEVSLSNAPCDMMSTETSGESAQVARSNFY